MTIKEIAKLAGVSSAAVSRYLNGGYVSAEKKEEIRRVIEETGYQPSAQARMLRTKKASLVGVVVPRINSESISRVTAGIEKVLAERNYRMLLAGTDNTPEKEIEYLKIFESYPVDGIVLVGTIVTAAHRKFFKECKVPVVVIGQHTKYANCIYHDDYEAGKLMGQMAGRLSKEKVAYLGVTKEDKAVGVSREEGFRSGLKSAGKTLEEDYKMTAEFSIQSGYEKTLELLEEKCDIDIISCATDTIAAGAIGALNDYEDGAYKEKIQVTGFGDNHLLKAVTGGIPTIHFGYMTSGIRGAEILLDAVERGGDLLIELKLGCRLVCNEE